jgi:hypothetical protein
MTHPYRARSADAWSLVWVVVDGHLHHVSDFAAVAARERPPARCPECGDIVTLKLGRVRRHHAAHAAHAVCDAAHPETALHLDCKLALAAALERALAGGSARSLTFIRRCAGPLLGASENCDATSVAPLADGWDAVAVERRVSDTLRPDVLLTRGDVPVAAIEIVVTHAVSADKARALDVLGVPWIEIDGAERLTSVDGWRLDEPIAIRAEGGRSPWRCAAHRAPLVAARVVDIYHSGGARERFIYRILATEAGGRSLRLQCGTREVATVSLADRAAARAAVRAAFDEDIRQLAAANGSFADSPMRWASGDAAENIVDDALFDRVGRDPTPLATTFPRRWFHSASSGQWFLPREMRAVRWDRPAADAFAAHPAWRNSPLRLRERAVPEAAWGEPFLASRPNAAMFGYDWQPRIIGDGVRLIVIDRDGAPVRAIAILEHTVADERVGSIAHQLAGEGHDVVWLLHPLDWSPALADRAWAVAGRDARGRGAVLVDGVGIMLAPRFARALAMGDRRFTASAIRRAMSARTDRLATRAPSD